MLKFLKKIKCKINFKKKTKTIKVCQKNNRPIWRFYGIKKNR